MTQTEEVEIETSAQQEKEGSTDTVTAWGTLQQEGDWKKVSTQSPEGDLFTRNLTAGTRPRGWN